MKNQLSTQAVPGPQASSARKSWSWQSNSPSDRSAPAALADGRAATSEEVQAQFAASWASLARANTESVALRFSQSYVPYRTTFLWTQGMLGHHRQRH